MEIEKKMGVKFHRRILTPEQVEKRNVKREEAAERWAQKREEELEWALEGMGVERRVREEQKEKIKMNEGENEKRMNMREKREEMMEKIQVEGVVKMVENGKEWRRVKEREERLVRMEEGVVGRKVDGVVRRTMTKNEIALEEWEMVGRVREERRAKDRVRYAERGWNAVMKVQTERDRVEELAKRAERKRELRREKKMEGMGVERRREWEEKERVKEWGKRWVEKKGG